MNTIEDYAPRYYEWDETTTTNVDDRFFEEDSEYLNRCGWHHCPAPHYERGQKVYMVGNTYAQPIYCCSLLCICLLEAYLIGHSSGFLEAQEKYKPAQSGATVTPPKQPANQGALL